MQHNSQYPLQVIIYGMTSLHDFSILCVIFQHTFYRAACNAARSSDEISVRLSVRPSVTRVHCDKTEERSVQIFIPYERTLS